MPGLKINQFTKEHDPAVAIAASSAASSTPLGGDLSGTPGSATVVAVGGIAITGAPSGAGDEIIATSTTAAHWATPPASLSNPMTAVDDLIVGGTVTGGVAAPARLGKGTDGQVLTVDPVTHHLYWATPGGGSLEVKEADGSPDVTGVTKIVLPNGSLTDNTGGQVTIAFPGGGGVIVQDEGTPLATTADTLNFAGAGVTATGAGTTKTITIPGGAGTVPWSPDTPPSSPNAADDEFSALSGWTTIGTLDTLDVTTFPGQLYMARSNAAVVYDGIRKAVPTAPFTVTVKLAMALLQVGHASAGLFLTDGTAIWSFDNDWASSNRYLDRRSWTNRTAFSSASAYLNYGTTGTPIVHYVRMIVTTLTNIELQYSYDGYFYTGLVTGLNPGFTATYIGLGISEPIGDSTLRKAVWDYIRFT